MSDYTTEAGRVEDMEGAPLLVQVDYDSVIIGATWRSPGYRLSLTQCEEFAGVFVAACWQAGRNAERMRQETADDGTCECGHPKNVHAEYEDRRANGCAECLCALLWYEDGTERRI